MQINVILFINALKQKAKSAFPKNNRHLGPSEVYVHFPRILIFYDYLSIILHSSPGAFGVGNATCPYDDDIAWNFDNGYGYVEDQTMKLTCSQGYTI